MIPPGSATGLVFQMEHFLLGAWGTGGQHAIMSCLMVLWIRNSGRAQPGDSFVPCGISQGYLVVLVGRWVVWRILDEFTCMPGALVGMAGRHAQLECLLEHLYLQVLASFQERKWKLQVS